MQHLLDFIHEHTLDEQLYIVAETPAGPLELQWRRLDSPEHWHIRPHRCEGPWDRIHRANLLPSLDARYANMPAIERELKLLVTTQIAFADLVLRDASEQLGRDLVQQAVLGHREFLGELRATVQQLTASARPSMAIVHGGGEQTTTRAGHLTLLR
jgi:hypothetical protein